MVLGELALMVVALFVAAVYLAWYVMVLGVKLAIYAIVIIGTVTAWVCAVLVQVSVALVRAAV